MYSVSGYINIDVAIENVARKAAVLNFIMNKLYILLPSYVSQYTSFQYNFWLNGSNNVAPVGIIGSKTHQAVPTLNQWDKGMK